MLHFELSLQEIHLQLQNLENCPNRKRQKRARMRLRSGRSRGLRLEPRRNRNPNARYISNENKKTWSYRPNE